MSVIDRMLISGLRRAVLPVLPRSRRLPFRYWLQARRGNGEQDLLHLDLFLAGGEVAVDVGANEGLYSYRLSRRFTHVFAFEVNDALTGDLAAYNPGNITIIHQGLSSREGSATLYIPVKNRRPLTGWGSLAPGNCPETQAHIEKTVSICPLDRFGLERVSFIKVDVEGHEIEVLKGASQTLARSRPVVLVEIKKQNRDELFALFGGLGYQVWRLQDLIGVPGSEEDFIFRPCEQPWPEMGGHQPSSRAVAPSAKP
jgi:FkbM family methyltransferase